MNNSREKINYKTQYIKHINKTAAGTSSRNYKSKPIDERIGARKFNKTKKTFQHDNCFYTSCMRNDKMKSDVVIDDLYNYRCYKSKKDRYKFLSTDASKSVNRRMKRKYSDCDNIYLDTTGKHIIKSNESNKSDLVKIF